MAGKIVVHSSLKIPFLYGTVVLMFLALKYLLLKEEDTFISFWRIGVIVGGIIVFYSFLRHLTTLYLVLDTELVEARGIFSRTVVRVPISRISNFQIEQSFFQRILGLATLKVDTPGNAAFEINMENLDVKNVASMAEVLTRLLEPLRSKGLTHAAA